MNQDLNQKVKEMLVESLRLTISPQEIQDDVILFGSESHLGLDSVDALEVLLELDRRYGIKIKDEDLGRQILRSVNTIVEAIAAAISREGEARAG